MSVTNTQYPKWLDQASYQNLLERTKNWTGKVIKDLTTTDIRPPSVLEKFTTTCLALMIIRASKSTSCDSTVINFITKRPFNPNISDVVESNYLEKFAHYYCCRRDDFSKCINGTSGYDSCVNIMRRLVEGALDSSNATSLQKECENASLFPMFERYLAPIFCMAIIESQIQQNRYLNDIGKYVLGSCFAAATAVAVEEDPFAGASLYVAYKAIDLVALPILHKVKEYLS